MEAPGSASGLETVAAALFPASRSPAVPLSAGGLASQTLEQPNSDKTTRLLSTLPRQRRRGRERPRTDKPSPLGFGPPSSIRHRRLPLVPPPSLRAHADTRVLISSDRSFIPPPPPLIFHIIFFFLFGGRQSRGNFEVAPMTGGEGAPHILLGA